MTNETQKTLEEKVENTLLRKPLLCSGHYETLHTHYGFEAETDDQTWTTYEFYLGNQKEIDSILTIVESQFSSYSEASRSRFQLSDTCTYSGRYIELKDKQLLPEVGKGLSPKERSQISSFEIPFTSKRELDYDEATFRELLSYLTNSTQYQFEESFEELGVAKRISDEIGFPTKDTLVKIHKIVREERIYGKPFQYKLVATDKVIPAYAIFGNGVENPNCDLPCEYFDQRWDNNIHEFIIGKRSYALRKKESEGGKK